MISENENNDFEIVMGDDTELNISEVGDIMNNLKPNTSKKNKNIIIPVAKKKDENKECSKNTTSHDIEVENTSTNNDEN